MGGRRREALLVSSKQIIAVDLLPVRADPAPECPRSGFQYLAGCSTAAARRIFSLEHAKRLGCLPLATWCEGECRVVSFLAPGDAPADLPFELRFITGCEVVIESAERGELELAIASAYCAAEDHLRPRLEAAEKKAGGSIEAPDVLRSAEAVPLLFEALLERAAALAASDIHLEPTAAGLQLRFRIDGRLRVDTSFTVSRSVGEQLLRRLKLLARLDTTCDFKPQEGGFSFAVGRRELRLRVSFVPQHHGEKAVLRLLENEPFAREKEECSAFHRLGLSLEQERLLVANLGATSGAVLLSGPTGSGKSTLLYAALEHLNAEWRNIVSLEDPVERTLPGVNQLEVKRDAMAAMLPALLRQDPDVLMVGEIRDRETGETALSAAITGHLVLSTVHAGSALEILPRLLQLGIGTQLLSCSLRLLVSQRLLPLNCRHCRRPAEIPDLWRRALRLGAAPVLASPGCAACRGTGILGRRGAFEFFPVTARVRERLWSAACEKYSLDTFAQLAREEGHVPLAFAVREAVLAGDVAPENALKSLGISTEFLTSLRADT